jgi:hypothetical protein
LVGLASFGVGNEDAAVRKKGGAREAAGAGLGGVGEELGRGEGAVGEKAAGVEAGGQQLQQRGVGVTRGKVKASLALANSRICVVCSLLLQSSFLARTASPSA